MTDNMRIWDQVCTTLPSQTKGVHKGGYSFTAIDAYSQIQKATEVFGPVGEGWGWHCEFSFRECGESTICYCEADIWWLDDQAEPAEDARLISIIGTATMAGTRSSGKRYVDDEAPKKALTDAITKGLSYLGFNADVFLGRFDDSKYVEQRREWEQMRNRFLTLFKSHSLTQAQADELIRSVSGNGEITGFGDLEGRPLDELERIGGAAAEALREGVTA